MIKSLFAAATAAVIATGALADDTMSNKEIVGTFLGAVLQGDVDTMRDLANPDYIQHNPFIPTGLEPFIELLPVLAEAVRRITSILTPQSNTSYGSVKFFRQHRENLRVPIIRQSFHKPMSHRGRLLGFSVSDPAATARASNGDHYEPSQPASPRPHDGA